MNKINVSILRNVLFNLCGQTASIWPVAVPMLMFMFALSIQFPLLFIIQAKRRSKCHKTVFCVQLAAYQHEMCTILFYSALATFVHCKLLCNHSDWDSRREHFLNVQFDTLKLYSAPAECEASISKH